MELGLGMVVKDEVNRITAALDPIFDLLADVVIIDTGSTDGTLDLLRERYRVEPISIEISMEDCLSLAVRRRFGMDRLRTDWILMLDGDEVMERAGLEALVRGPDPDCHGLFAEWRNHMADGAVFEDYKCPIFRSPARPWGCIHENVQVDLRTKGLRARWQPGLLLNHYPEGVKVPAKRRRYEDRLHCCRAKDPDWLRYDWFLGYMLFRDGLHDRAEPLLRRVAFTPDPRFPVERLNAFTVLADLLLREGRTAEVPAVLDAAVALFKAEEGEFEVVINFRLGPWLHGAQAAAAEQRWSDIKSYRFAC